MSDELRVEAHVAGEWAHLVTLADPGATETAVAVNADAGVSVRLVDARGEEVDAR